MSTLRQPGSIVDSSNCDREPIHVPGSVQPHGALLVLGPTGDVLQASGNVGEFFGRPGRTLSALVGDDLAREIETGVASLPASARPVILCTTRIGSKPTHVLAHRNDAGVIVEFERVGDEPTSAGQMLHLVDAFTLMVEESNSVRELSEVTCRELRRLTGYDRVLVYQFDAQWNGAVVGEDGNGRLPSYAGHHFPASDIPAQARELYRINRTRIIPDASYVPVPIEPAINPQTGKPLDMTFATLRSGSPVHVEYMRNMETASSMSISIVRAGKLWGLISCHHRTPKHVPLPLRETCELFARAFSLRLGAIEQVHEYARRMEVRSAYSRLLAHMADRGDFAAALVERPAELLDIASAGGAAILTEGGCVQCGETPTEAQTRELAEWLFAHVKEEVYATDSLPAAHPAAEAYVNRASGLLAVAVSKIHPSYVMWFRPETILTIRWAGEPAKTMQPIGDEVVLRPRRSFETWKETVRLTSQPWRPSEIEAVHDLRNAIVGIVLRKAEELAELNTELTRSNKELEAFSYSVSHDLRAPLRHIVGYAEILKESGVGKFTPRDERCLATIIESSEYAGRLVDKLLEFSRLGRADLQVAAVDLNLLVKEIRADVMRDVDGRDGIGRDGIGREVEWRVSDLPTVAGDVMMLRMAFRDLLANAVKYTRGKPKAIIEIGHRDLAKEHLFFVKDNGVGFDMAYVDKLFGVFQRLHKWEDYEGTGIGLANVRRVIERHGGRTWAEGQEGEGATFSLTLPKRQ